MLNEKLTAILHQFLMMLRDPVIYLAIDENNGGFDADEIIFIRMAKARALLSMYRLNEAQDQSFKLYRELKDSSEPEIQLLNLITLINTQNLLGNNIGAKSYAEEAHLICIDAQDATVKTLVDCASITLINNKLKLMESKLQKLAKKLDNITQPFVRLCVLSCLGYGYNTLQKYDLGLSYYSAAYDLSNQHELSIASLETTFAILDCCAKLQKHKMGEEFYELGNRLIAQLRMYFFEVQLNFNYALLKYAIKDYKASIYFFQKSLQSLHSTDVKMPALLFEIYNNLAKALNHLELGEQALHYQLLAEKLLKEDSQKERRINLSANIALSLISLHNWEDALKRLREAERFYKQNHLIENLIKVSRALAYYYQKRNNYLRALVMMRRVDELNRDHITALKQKRSQISENKLQQILDDSRAIKAKYETLLNDISKRQIERFIGISKAAKRVIDSALLASMHRDASVLIHGESGTGKEVLARMIHYSSAQKNLPFVTVNCAAISPALFETEFFGSAAGNLTGTTKERHGFFEQAGAGTLFLDEISEIPHDFQAKLLWAMDTMKYNTVGKEDSKPIRCRLIASTNRDILELIKEDSLRLELLHRLNTLEISIPPLKERLEDIPVLVEHFARNFARETSKRLPRIRDSFYDRLNSYKFPGNVRELKNIIERIFILFYKPVWTAEILDNIDAFKRSIALRGSLINHNIKDLDKERIIEALQKTGGKQKTAAKLLNMTESTLCRKIKRYKIK